MTYVDSTSWFNVGDPTILGWFTLLAYLLAAMSAWRASRVCRWGFLAMRASDPLEADRQNRLAAWWMGVAILLVMLGINKELDVLQKLVRIWGKAAALEQGWYESRKVVQRTFVAVLVLLSVVTGAAVFHFLRDVWRRIALASAGVALIVSYVLLRAAIFNVVPVGSRGLLVTSMWVLELGGVILVLWCAARAARSPGRGAK